MAADGSLSTRRRQALLTGRRNLKMASSAHAYVRGSTLQFYRWLDAAGAKAVPNGPAVWICGDCHVGNLGPLSDTSGHVSVLIRDLDQTVIGNPNHDLIRLALSLASAARGSDLPGVATAHMMESMTDGYIRALTGRSNLHDSPNPESVRIVMRKAMRRTWKHLARERIKDMKPRFPRGERFWSLGTGEMRRVERLFEDDEVRKLVASLRSRENDVSLEVLDAAHWMKGCSSLGKLRLAVLVNITDRNDESEHCLIDIKEAGAAAAPRARDAGMPKDPAKRVVEGALHLSPALGKRMLALQLFDRPVFLRELMPQDMKLEVETLTKEEAVLMARFLAGVVGRAHGRQMDAATRREFAASLKKRRSKRIDAPSWLWSSVVDLASLHEAAYLEHCRTYALG
jgi:uncharacterized protein (DUF2252 family)